MRQDMMYIRRRDVHPAAQAALAPRMRRQVSRAPALPAPIIQPLDRRVAFELPLALMQLAATVLHQPIAAGVCAES